MNGVVLVGLDRSLLVHGLAGDIENAAHDAFAYGHGNGRAGIHDLQATLESLGAGHRDRTNPIVSKMLLDFERKLGWLVHDFVIDGQRIINAWTNQPSLRSKSSNI